MAALAIVVASAALAHDLFIKLDSYFVPPNARVQIPILNGTFFVSENGVAAERVQDASLVRAGDRVRLDTTVWSLRNDSTFLSVATGDPGTYVVGVSIRPNHIQLTGAEFNEYLEHDGIPDVLEARRRDGELDRGVVEQYHKHVKAVFQVGERRTGEFGTVLGYPAEIVPLQNPYALRAGGELAVRCLVDGEPVAHQLVIAGGEGPGGSIAERAARTDSSGVARFVLDAPGKWYVKFIYMVRASEAGLDYESKWATLTFETRTVNR
jgi:hypothetical protein